MEIKIEIETLRKNKLFIATPMYGGQCAGMFTKSVADLSAFCAKHQIPLQLYFMFNESLITRARNYCCDEFMRSDANHLMFIDSDIGFNPQDVIALMALQSQNEDYDIIGGPYPKKCISWEKIKRAVDKGVADEESNVLEKFVGDYVFNPKSGQNQIKQTDFDGMFTYSSVISIEFNRGNNYIISAQPNPFSNELKVRIESNRSRKVLLEIYNYRGKLFFREEQFIDNGLNWVDPPVDGFSSGLYFISIRGNGIEHHLKVLKH